MKKIMNIVLLVLGMCLLSGCGQDTNDASEYHIFYMNKEKTKIVEQSYTPEDKDTDAMIRDYLVALSTDVDSVEYQKPIPNDVEITNYKLDGGQLSIYFDSDYYKMDVAEEVLCRAAIVRTLIQIKDIYCLSFYVGDAPLTDNKGSLVGLMTEESFVENPGEQINAIQTANLSLYFSNKAGDGLVLTEEEVQYSSNISMEKLIIENLLAGPSDKNLKAPIPDGTKLISVTTTNGTCYVNFDEGFTNQNYEIQEPIVIYSIVDSLSEVATINRVQILVNGDSTGMYRDSMSLEQLYERNLDFVENVVEATEIIDSSEIKEEGAQ